LALGLFQDFRFAQAFLLFSLQLPPNRAITINLDFVSSKNNYLIFSFLAFLINPSLAGGLQCRPQLFRAL